MSIEVRQVRRFDQVRFIGPGTLKITQGEKEALTIHAPAYVMENVVSSVESGLLTLGYRSPKITRLRVLKEIISFNLVMKDLRRLTVTGTGSVIIPDLDNDAIRLEIQGSGKINLEHLTADSLHTLIKGSGFLRVAGDVEAQSVSVNGSGKYDAEKLVSDFAQVALNGSGHVAVSVTDDLNVVINGSGKVTYSGFPEVSKAISGSGSVSRRRREKTTHNAGEDHG